MARFQKLEVWKALRRRGGLHSWEVAEELLIDTGAAIKHLHWLVAHGCAVREGRYRRRKWFATVKRPESGKGLAPASLAALARGQHKWKERLVLADAKKAELLASGQYTVRRTSRLPQKGRPGYGATLLEQLWPVSGSFARVVRVGDDYGREGAPEDNAQEEAA